MQRRHVWRLLLAVIGLGWMAVLARADVEPSLPRVKRPIDGDPRNHSHVPIPAQGITTDPQQLFEDRLRQAKALGDLRKHIEDIAGQDLDSLLKDLKKAGIDPNSPEFRKLVEKEIERQARNPNPRLSPEELDTLKRLFKDLFPDGVPGKDPKTGKTTNPLGNGDKGTKQDPSRTDPSKGNDWVKTQKDQEDLEEASRQMANFARRLDGLSGKVKNSPAMQKALGDLTRLALENSRGKQGGLDTQLARLNRWGRDGDSWFGKNGMSLRRFEMPRLPSLSLPTLRLPGGGLSIGVPGGVPIPAGGGSWRWLLWLGVIVGVAVMLWKLLPRVLLGKTAAVEDTWRLGPWPVAPNAVASRAELIRAFEYLSLLLLGRRARTWNHREIAAKLGANEQVRRRAAAQLAALYEQARYAPDDEPLSTEAVADFRRELCLLAGVEGA